MDVAAKPVKPVGADNGRHSIKTQAGLALRSTFGDAE
jgi:hypothetical protein